jgi:imidazolonepropionase-like amidohydrolase
MGLLFRDARVIDGLGGAVDRGWVLVEGDRIARVGTGPAPADGHRVVDAGGASLLPGFIDCHVHLRSEGGPDPVGQVMQDSDPMVALRIARNAWRTLRAGLTTVRDCGGKNHVEFVARAAMAEGLFLGPRLLLAGKAVCMTGGHAWRYGREADGPDDVRKAVREQLKAGADFVKFIATGGIMTPEVEIGSPQLSVDELRAGIEEVHHAGRKASAHAHGLQGIRNALAAGIDSIEHGYFLDDEAAALMVERGVTLVPTSAAVQTVARLGTEAGIPAPAVRKARFALEHHVRSFQRAHRAGVRLAMGTDTGVPCMRHGENLQELAAMVGLGLTPMEAIVATTSAAAAFLGRPELGAIEAGRRADLVVVDGDPLADVAVLARREAIRAVYLDGREVVSRGMTEPADGDLIAVAARARA